MQEGYSIYFIRMRPAVPLSFGFYAILTDPLRGYEYMTRLFVDYKIPFVQLRIKDAALKAILPIAKTMRVLTMNTKTRLIVNDYPALAVLTGADGVHVGQTDLPYGEVREIVGEEAILGLSTHSVAQAKAACALHPDYIGVGPVYPTPTKKTPDPVIGLAMMKEMISSSDVPAVAIGGITLENLPDVLQAGARNFCMVRPLNQTSEPEKVLKEILKTYEDFLKK
jgi:thiamine-phosphate pyrophosphorylase